MVVALWRSLTGRDTKPVTTDDGCRAQATVSTRLALLAAHCIDAHVAIGTIRVGEALRLWAMVCLAHAPFAMVERRAIAVAGARRHAGAVHADVPGGGTVLVINTLSPGHWVYLAVTAQAHVAQTAICIRRANPFASAVATTTCVSALAVEFAGWLRRHLHALARYTALPCEAIAVADALRGGRRCGCFGGCSAHGRHQHGRADGRGAPGTQ